MAKKKNAAAVAEKNTASADDPADESADSGKVLKVLYIHGYEEQVSGTDISPKPKCLIDAADLDVLAPELLVWVSQWNSPLWQVAMVPYFHASIFVRCAAGCRRLARHFLPPVALVACRLTRAGACLVSASACVSCC